MDDIRICGIVFEHGENDFGYWDGFSLTEDEENEIMKILSMNIWGYMILCYESFIDHVLSVLEGLGI